MSGEDKELEDLNAADFADMGSLADFVDIEDLENLEGIEEFKSDEQSEDAPMPAEEVSEEIPMSVEKEVSEEIPMPVEEEVSEEVPMPVEEKVSEEIPMPVEPVEEEVPEEIPMPVEEEVSEEIPMSVAEASEEIPAPIDDGGTEEISQPAGDSATINTSELLDNINLYSDDVSGGDSAETAALMNDGKSESSTDDQALNMMLDGLLDDLDMTGSLQQETASKDELVEDQDAEAADIFDMLGADSESQDVSIDDLLDIAAPEEYPEEEPTDQKGLFQRVFGNVINDEIAEEERKAQEEEERKAQEEEEQKAAEKAELAEQKKAEKEQAKEAKKAEKEAKKAAKAEEKAAKKAEKEAKKAEQKAQQEEEAEAEKYEVTGKLNKVGVAIIAILTVTFLVVEIAGTNIHGYSSSKKQAMKYFEMGKYEQAYQEVLGTKVKEKDPDTYNKIRTVMQVQRALDSYQNYDAMNYYPDALNALIRGLQRYDANLETAKQLEIEDEVDGCKEQIVSLLQSEYGVSESQARELLSLDKAEYTSKVVEIAMKKNTGNE